MSSKASFLTGSSSAAWRSSSLRLLLRTATTSRAEAATRRTSSTHPMGPAYGPRAIRGSRTRAPKAAAASRSSSGDSIVNG